MKLDPVMAEIRAYREAYAEKFDGDITAMLDDIEKRTRESGRKTVALPPKRIPGWQEDAPAAARLAKCRSESDGNN